MHLSIRHTFFLTAAFTLLLIGLSQYVLLQPTSWLSHFFPFAFRPIHFQNNYLNDFIRFHLSDISWSIALCICVVVLTEKMKISLTERYVLLSLPFVTELFQKLHIIKGTFDWYDMLCYLVVVSLFISIFPHIIYHHEKN